MLGGLTAVHTGTAAGRRTTAWGSLEAGLPSDDGGKAATDGGGNGSAAPSGSGREKTGRHVEGGGGPLSSHEDLLTPDSRNGCLG